MILLNKIEAIAPDQASLNAARKLLAQNKWPISSIASDNSFIWGECQGSGSTPYRACVTPADLGYKYTCPSRKSPCKHALALMWHYSEKPDEFSSGETPQWVLDWSSRRRTTTSTATPTSTKKNGSIHQALTDKEKPKDPKTLARAAEAKAKNKQKREQLILTGLEDFRLWLADVYDLGLVQFQHDCRAQCRQAAKRLVDAKASGIASQLDELSREVLQFPEQQRPRYIFQTLSSLYLLAQAYQQQSKLPTDLQQDVRRLVGWTLTRDQLMNEADAVKVSDRWRVLTLREYIQNDGLRRIETWLGRLNTQYSEYNFAVLIDFYPVASGHTRAPYLPGEILEGAIIFYPSATPLLWLIIRSSRAVTTRCWHSRYKPH